MDEEQQKLIREELQRRATDADNPLRSAYAKWVDNIGYVSLDPLECAAIAWELYVKYYDRWERLLTAFVQAQAQSSNDTIPENLP